MILMLPCGGMGGSNGDVVCGLIGDASKALAFYLACRRRLSFIIAGVTCSG